MNNVNEVIRFLADFKVKLDTWGIIFRDDRGKNFQTLLDLELSYNTRIQLLKDLKKEEYSAGPLEDKLYGKASMWVFGKTVKGKEMYIKVTLGSASAKVICISFHTSAHPMNYPLKSET
jgi:hypothetical protein